jgi:hypothetical protein
MPSLLPTYQTDSRTESLASRQKKSKDESSSIVTQMSAPRESSRLRRLEADEEQVYLIARNIHLTLHTLMINAKYKTSKLTLYFHFSIE